MRKGKSVPFGTMELWNYYIAQNREMKLFTSTEHTVKV